MPTLSPPNGQRRCAALPPSLHILHIWEYNYRLFPKQTLFIIKTAFLSRQPPPPDCAATRRSPAGENRVLVPLTLPGQLAPLCAQAVRGMRLCVNRFSNGQRRTAALPVNKLILHSKTTDALRRAAAEGVGGTETKHNKKVPFSPLENKIETDKTYAPFVPKWTTPQECAGSAYACGVHRKP